ncbi:MAG TPA: hypothetical protein VG796_21790 [Verrucomicrobiales bacterium]|nr:hypothetical protein [Verrucomicrobiales bacterium]
MNLNAPFFATLAVAALTGWIGMGWFSSQAKDTARRVPVIPREAEENIDPNQTDSESLIRRVHRPGHPEDEPLAALQLAKQIAPADFVRFMEADHLLPDSAAKAVFRLAAVRRWLISDPRAAVNWCAGHDDRLFTEAVKEWTRMDPAAAEAFSAGMPARLRDTALTVVAGVLASSDPDSLTGFIQRTGASLNASELAPGFRSIAQRDLQTLLNLTEQLPSHLQSQAQWEAAIAMAAKDLHGAISWAQKQTESSMLLGCILSTGLPPEKLLPAFASLTVEQQKEVLEDNRGSWASRDPGGLLKVLRAAEEAGILDEGTEPLPRADSPEDRFPSERSFRESAISSALNYLLEEGPVEALAAIQQHFPDHPEWWVKQLAESWGLKDPAAASAWAAQLPNEELREKALSTISNRSSVPIWDLEIMSYGADQLDEYSPEKRMKMLDSASGHAPSHSLKDTEYRIRNCQPQEYSLWLAAQPPSENTNARIEMFIREWGAEEPAAAAAWLGTQPESEGKQKASHDLMLLWKSLSPKDAKAWQDAAGLQRE